MITASIAANLAITLAAAFAVFMVAIAVGAVALFGKSEKPRPGARG